MSDYSNYSILEEAEPVRVPIWREVMWPAEWLLLRASPTYYGIGVPKGDGSQAVVVIPGFMGSDLYLTEFRFWLRRMGYKAYQSRIGRNADCLNISGERVTKTVTKAYERTGRKVHLIGHSLGGLLARGVARMHPEMVASVVVLGSPFRAIRAHPLVLTVGDFIRSTIHSRHSTDQVKADCFTGHCSCTYVQALHHDLPDEVAQRAIYTRTDGVVDWQYCVNDDPETDIEVKGTHVGLAFHAGVYGHIARFYDELNKSSD